MSDVTFTTKAYELTLAERAELDDVYGSTDLATNMAYGYAFGRIDGGSKARVYTTGIGSSETYTALWFAKLYVESLENTISYGHAGSWENFEKSHGASVL